MSKEWDSGFGGAGVDTDRGRDSDVGMDYNGFTVDLLHIGLTIKFELLRHFRRKRIYVVLAFSLFISLFYYLIGNIVNHNFPDDWEEFTFINLVFLNFFIIIIASVFGGDSVSGDFQKKTGLLLFTTPQRRTSIFLGKYLASLLAVHFFITVIYVITAIEVTQLYGYSTLSMGFTQSYLLALLYSASVLSLVFFFSSFMKNSSTSSIVGFFLLFLILPMMSGIFMVLWTEPWFIITNQSALMYYIIDSGHDFDSISGVSELWVGICVIISYLVLLLISGVFLGCRRQMD